MTREVIGGVPVQFGPRNSEVDSPAEADDLVRTIVQPIYTTPGSAVLFPPSDYDASVLMNVIPAKSLIKSASIYVEDAFTSTATATGIDAGLVRQSDGSTEIDFNGLIAVGGIGAKANLVAGTFQAGDGAKIGKVSDLTYDAVPYAKWAAGTDTLTGTGVLVIEYIPSLTAYLADKT